MVTVVSLLCLYITSSFFFFPQFQSLQKISWSKVPKLCHLGSKLKNLAFEVVNSKGDVDHTIHDSYKHGRSDTLRLKTDFPGFDDSLRYAFKLGRCVIPSITLPLTEGTFCIEANHCQHLELCAKFEVSQNCILVHYPFGCYIHTIINVSDFTLQIRVSRSTCTEKDILSDLRASDQLYLKDRSASGSVSDAVKPVTNRKRSALRDSEVRCWNILDLLFLLSSS